MTPAHVPGSFFTVASLVLAGLILLALRLMMAKSTANLCIAGFLAFVIPSPLMLVAHANIALAMAGIGLACVVPAYLLAEDRDDDDDWRGGRRGPEPTGPDADPDPGFDPELWSEFERDFWSHVERRRDLVEV